MTVAIDPKTNRPIGQVVATLPPGTLKTGLPSEVSALVLLGRGGRYVTVPASSVRLEELR